MQEMPTSSNFRHLTLWIADSPWQTAATRKGGLSVRMWMNSAKKSSFVLPVATLISLVVL